MSLEKLGYENTVRGGQSGMPVEDYSSLSVLTQMLMEIKLLNARFEEAFRTNITMDDINEN